MDNALFRLPHGAQGEYTHYHLQTASEARQALQGHMGSIVPRIDDFKSDEEEYARWASEKDEVASFR